ncbi:MAG: Hpt domain-containing protein [Oligoflexales bacterium]|nr:Hpt domain-containing protein [Oligoflexales bacterium]
MTSESKKSDFAISPIQSKLSDEFKGDEDILLKMIGIYQQKSEGYMKSLEDSIEEQRVDDIIHHSHTFKGAIANFTIDSPFKILREIETLTKSSQLEKLPELLGDLRSPLIILGDALAELKTKLEND